MAAESPVPGINGAANGVKAGEMPDDVASYDPGNINGSFTRLYVKYHPYSVSVIAKHIGYDGSQADLAAELWLKIYRNMRSGDLKPKANMSTYFCRAAVNRATDYLRKRRPNIVEYDTAVDETRATGTSALVRLIEGELYEESRRAAQQALDALPDKFREVLLLRYLNDVSHADLARMVGASLPATRWRLGRARKMFRLNYQRVIERLGGEEPANPQDQVHARDLEDILSHAVPARQ